MIKFLLGITVGGLLTGAIAVFTTECKWKSDQQVCEASSAFSKEAKDIPETEARLQVKAPVYCGDCSRPPGCEWGCIDREVAND